MKTLLLLLALVTAGCVSNAGIKEIGEDMTSVQAVLDRQQAAWNAGDIEAFMAEGYWNSSKLVFLSGGDWTWGYDAVLERYRDRYLSEDSEMGTLAFSDVQVIPLSEKASLARGRYHLDFTDGGTADGLFSLVLAKMEDGWRIVQDHTSAAAPGE